MVSRLKAQNRSSVHKGKHFFCILQFVFCHTFHSISVSGISCPVELYLVQAGTELNIGRFCHDEQLTAVIFQKGQTLCPLFIELCKLAFKDILGIDAPPAFQIVIGIAGHGGSVARGLGKEQIADTAILGSPVQNPNIKGELLESLAEQGSRLLLQGVSGSFRRNIWQQTGYSGRGSHPVSS